MACQRRALYSPSATAELQVSTSFFCFIIKYCFYRNKWWSTEYFKSYTEVYRPLTKLYFVNFSDVVAQSYVFSTKERVSTQKAVSNEIAYEVRACRLITAVLAKSIGVRCVGGAMNWWRLPPSAKSDVLAADSRLMDCRSDAHSSDTDLHPEQSSIV